MTTAAETESDLSRSALFPVLLLSLMRRTFPLAVLLIWAALSQAGCLFYSREIAQTKSALEAEHPEARFTQQTMLNLGPLSLWMASGLMRLTAKEDYAEVRPYLRYLHRVQIGIYEAEGLSSLNTIEPSTLPPLQEGGWQVALHTRQSAERVWVLYRLSPQGPAVLNDLYVVTLDHEELVALRLRGQIDRLVQHYLQREDVLDDLLGQDGE